MRWHALFCSQATDYDAGKNPPTWPKPVVPPQSLPAVHPETLQKVLEHVPHNKSAFGACFKSPTPMMGEVHDMFRGHTAKQTVRRFRRWRLWSAAVAANCTGFLQWHDLYLFHLLRPRITTRLIDLLDQRQNGHDGDLTEPEWRNMLAQAVCLAFFDPLFLPAHQIQQQMIALGLLAALDGSADDKVETKLFNYKVRTEYIAPLSMKILQQLQDAFEKEKSLEQPREFGGCSDDEQEEGDEKEEDGEEGDETADEGEIDEDKFLRSVSGNCCQLPATAFSRCAAQIATGDFVAVAVDPEKEEGMPFYIGRVTTVRDEKLTVTWISRKGKDRLNLGGKWTLDLLKGTNEPSSDTINRSAVIPVPIQWHGEGFELKKGGYLVERCRCLVEEWLADDGAKEAQARIRKGEENKKARAKKPKTTH